MASKGREKFTYIDCALPVNYARKLVTKPGVKKVARSASSYPTFVGFSYGRAALKNNNLPQSRFIHLTREVSPKKSPLILSQI